MMIAEREFIIDSSRERIWALISKAVLRLMPFERMQIRSEKNFHAVLRMKMGIITLPVNVEIELVDICAPESLVTTLKAKGMWGMFWLNQKSTFTLTAIGEDKTDVVCKIVDEGMAVLLRILLLWKVKYFAEDAFKNLEERLRQWA